MQCNLRIYLLKLEVCHEKLECNLITIVMMNMKGSEPHGRLEMPAAVMQ